MPLSLKIDDIDSFLLCLGIDSWKESCLLLVFMFSVCFFILNVVMTTHQPLTYNCHFWRNVFLQTLTWIKPDSKLHHQAAENKMGNWNKYYHEFLFIHWRKKIEKKNCPNLLMFFWHTHWENRDTVATVTWWCIDLVLHVIN